MVGVFSGMRFMRVGLVALMFLLSGCGGPSSTLIVQNDTSESFTNLYVSPSSLGAWGNNRLQGTIPPTGSFTLSGIVPGYYDLRIVTSSARSAERYDIYFGKDEAWTWTLAETAKGRQFDSTLDGDWDPTILGVSVFD